MCPGPASARALVTLNCDSLLGPLAGRTVELLKGENHLPSPSGAGPDPCRLFANALNGWTNGLCLPGAYTLRTEEEMRGDEKLRGEPGLRVTDVHFASTRKYKMANATRHTIHER